MKAANSLNPDDIKWPCYANQALRSGWAEWLDAAKRKDSWDVSLSEDATWDSFAAFYDQEHAGRSVGDVAHSRLDYLAEVKLDEEDDDGEDVAAPQAKWDAWIEDHRDRGTWDSALDDSATWAAFKAFFDASKADKSFQDVATEWIDVLVEQLLDLDDDGEMAIAPAGEISLSKEPRAIDWSSSRPGRAVREGPQNKTLVAVDHRSGPRPVSTDRKSAGSQIILERKYVKNQ